MPESTSGYHNSAIAAVPLLEWSLAQIQTGTSSIFPNHSRARFGEIRDQEPLSTGSLYTAFLFWLLREVNGMNKSPLCQLASENSARPVEFTVVDVAITFMQSKKVIFITVLLCRREMTLENGGLHSNSYHRCLPLALQLQ